MPDTLLKQALRKAGAPIGKSRLYVEATDELQKAQAKSSVPTADFAERVWSDDELLAALVRSTMERRDCASLSDSFLSMVEGYLSKVETDMRGAVCGGGHSERDAHANVAPATQNKIGGNADADGLGHWSRDAQNDRSRPSAANSETPAAQRQVQPAGQTTNGHQLLVAGGHPIPETPPRAAGAVHLLSDAHLKGDRPKVSPGHSRRGLTAMASVQETVARSLLDTFMVNGRPVGDVTVEEADRWVAGRERDARFVKMLITGLPHGATIRTHITEADAKRIWSLAQNAPAVTAPVIDARHPDDYREIPNV
jgi:hypothetical protein